MNEQMVMVYFTEVSFIEDGKVEINADTIVRVPSKLEDDAVLRARADLALIEEASAVNNASVPRKKAKTIEAYPEDDA